MPQIIPLIPSIVQGVGMLVGAVKGRGKPSGEAEESGYTMAAGAGQAGLARAAEVAPYTTNLMELSKSGYQPAFDYWSRILSGDRSEMTSVLSPEIARIGEGYTQARREVGQFAPRGGGRASTLGEIPFRRGRDVSELFAKMRPLAAQSLGQLAGEAGRMGVSSGFLEAQLGGMPIQAAKVLLDAAAKKKQDWWNRVMAGAQGAGQVGAWMGSTLGAGTKGGGTASGPNLGEIGATGGSSGVYP